MRLIVEFTLSRSADDLVADILRAGGHVPSGYPPVRMSGNPPTVCVIVECSSHVLESIRRIPEFVKYYGDTEASPTALR